MKSARILVVDDERSLREFLEIFFERDGYSVTTAASVAEALVALDADDFDVVISDVQMGEASGLELLRTVKETAPGCVVIMITAQKPVQHLAFQQSADYFNAV
jgi:two-component system response regulator PilR (NtrC family)